MKKGRSRGIAYITYDTNGNPSRIYFTNGNVTKYSYSASGLKFGAEPNARTHDYRETIKESLWVCSKELDSKNSCGQKPQLFYCANLRF